MLLHSVKVRTKQDVGLDEILIEGVRTRADATAGVLPLAVLHVQGAAKKADW